MAIAPWLVMLGACNSSGSGSDDAPPGIDREFGPPTTEQIRPGVRVSSSYGACTSNFLFAANAVTYYLGVAAHCFANDPDGADPCESANAPAGFDGITIQNASRPATLIYSSWSAMQQQGETPGSDRCTHNDFALVQLHADDIASAHPAALEFGGPTGLFAGLAAVGDEVFSYGQSDFHLGIPGREIKEGEVTAVLGGGLGYRVRFDNAGVPGDSGSAVLHEDGRALGVLSNLTFGLLTAPSNGIVNLEAALNYARAGGFVPGSTQLLTWADFAP